jgi:hypothetical protein
MLTAFLGKVNSERSRDRSGNLVVSVGGAEENNERDQRFPVELFHCVLRVVAPSASGWTAGIIATASRARS